MLAPLSMSSLVKIAPTLNVWLRLSLIEVMEVVWRPPPRRSCANTAVVAARRRSFDDPLMAMSSLSV